MLELKHDHPHPADVYQLLGLFDKNVFLTHDEIPVELHNAVLYAATNTPLLVGGEAELIVSGKSLTLGSSGDDDFDEARLTASAVRFAGNATWSRTLAGLHELCRYRMIEGVPDDATPPPGELDLSHGMSEFIDPLREGPLHREEHEERLKEKEDEVLDNRTYRKRLQRAREGKIVEVRGKTVHLLVDVTRDDVTKVSRDK